MHALMYSLIWAWFHSFLSSYRDCGRSNNMFRHKAFFYNLFHIYLDTFVLRLRKCLVVLIQHCLSQSLTRSLGNGMKGITILCFAAAVGVRCRRHGNEKSLFALAHLIEAAKKRDVKFGRPAKPLPDNWQEVLAEVHSGKIKPVEAIRELGISRSCYYRLYNK